MYLLGLKRCHEASNLDRAEEANNAVESNESQLRERLKVVWCANLDHGQIFGSKRWREQLVKEVFSHIARQGNRDAKLVEASDHYFLGRS